MNKHIVCTPEGCYRTRDVKRLPPASQSSVQLFSSVPCATYEPKWGKPPGRLTRTGPMPFPEDIGEDEPEGTDVGIPPTPPLFPLIPPMSEQDGGGRQGSKVKSEKRTEVEMSEMFREAVIPAPGPVEAVIPAPGQAATSSAPEVGPPDIHRPMEDDEDRQHDEDEPRSKRVKTVGGLVTLDVPLVSDDDLVEAMRLDALTDHPEEGPENLQERKRLLKEGTHLELDRLQQFTAYKPVLKKDSSHVIPTRWVYRFKRDKNAQWFGRARLVAKDFASWATSEYFAPTTGVSTSRVLDIITA